MTQADAYTALATPRSVAILGASGNTNKLSARPLAFLKSHGFGGSLFPVNPGQSEISGYRCYADLRDLPEVPEHVYVLLDGDAAIEAVETCGKLGVKCVSVLADGFSEAGVAGQARQDKLVAFARAYGILLIGPNSIGVANTRNGFICTSNAAFAAERLPTGRFNVLSQSGSVIGAILSRAAAVGLGFGTYVSLGNEAAANVSSVGRLMVADPEVDGFVLFLETLRDRAEFAAFASETRQAGKPILAYLVGRSEAGSSLAASHTGAIAGGGRALEAYLKAHGVCLVDSFEALAEMSNAYSLQRRLAGRPRKVTVVTTTGGGGGMVYDRIGLRGVPLSPMSEESRLKLSAKGIEVKAGPLVDVTLAGTKYEVMRTVVETLIADPESGLVVAAVGSSAQFNPELAVRPIVDAVTAAGTDAAPVLAIPIPHAPESLAMFNAKGVPACRTIEGGAEVIAALFQERPFQAAETTAPLVGLETLLASFGCGALTETEAANVFRALGIAGAQTVIFGLDDALPSAFNFDGPYVLKAISRDILHKSEKGGVRVGLGNAIEVRKALHKMKIAVAERAPSAVIEGYLVQQMEKGLAEAIIGLHRDPVAGPMVTVGAGGILTEIYRDIASRPAPVSVATARAMLDEVKAFALLRGYRGARKGDIEALAQAVAQVSTLGACDRVSEAEINPVLVRAEGEGVVAVDALIKLS